MNKEIWKDVPGFEGLYQISNYGRIYSIYKHDYKKLRRKRKYLYLRTADDKQIAIHRLVALLFVPNPYNKPIVHHIDGNCLNNKADNLIWVTDKEHHILHGHTYHTVDYDYRYDNTNKRNQLKKELYIKKKISQLQSRIQTIQNQIDLKQSKINELQKEIEALSYNI